MENMFAPSESATTDASKGLSPSPTKTFSLEKDEVVYDDVFVVRESRYGLFISFVTTDGREVITAGTREECIKVTRFHLKGEQEGFPPECYLSSYAAEKRIDL